LDRDDDMILRRTEEGALKWALRLLRREEETSGCSYLSASYSPNRSHPRFSISIQLVLSRNLTSRMDTEVEQTTSEYNDRTDQGCTSS